MQRQPEPELMDLPEEARAYADADFAEGTDDYIRQALEFSRDHEALRVVDLGTGPGSIPILLAEARPGWKITAIDLSAAMLTIAREQSSHLQHRITWMPGDVKATGLPAWSFDLVLCNSVLHHMPDPLPLWREIRRLAAPTGHVFVRDLRRPECEEDAHRLVELHASGESALLQEEYYRSLLAAFTIDEVRGQLVAAGMQSMSVQASSDRYINVFGRLGA